MTSAIRKNSQEPLSIIFLGIDGVMIEDHVSSDTLSSLNVLHEVAGLKVSRLQARSIVSNRFSKEAISNLGHLIQRVSAVGKVAIVLSSHWRNELTLDDLRHRTFSNVSFPKKIIDKTPDLDICRQKRGLPPLSPVAFQKYGFHLESQGAEIRGREIEFWLRENQHKYNIRSFVILDDQDTELSARFPNNFVEVKNCLSKSDVEKAYQILTKTKDSSK